MKAIWLENQSLHLRDDLPMPEPKAGEALVRMRLAGVCATDLEMAGGYYPFTGVLGHEFTGLVEWVPDGSDLLGQRVVGEINLSCQECQTCRAGRPTHCERRSVLGILGKDGVFAEYLTLPVQNLHVIPEAMPDEMAVFTEPLAAALEILEQAAPPPDERVLLIGAGRLGQLIAQVLALTGCDLSVVARHDHQCALLANSGIRTISESEIEAGRWERVVEATGTPGGLELARHAVRPRGVIVLKSTYRGDVTLNLSQVVVDEITLLGSRCGPFEPALRLMASGRVDPRPLISARYPLDEGLLAIEHAAQPGALKVLIEN